ncbi:MULTISPECIES: signal peptide peptidase SppA [Thalassospira]|jgi:protease-4|uniref:Signal peptide peptidase SppA n=3 Tax=Thalassospira TaxID=168934 RepID=A0ABX4R9L5_9PROT|nr:MULTISPECIES: signal peptide peptidase SppA [Thalassospira]MEE3045355.1 signal peptide peptidase SppA [Pseudomonadota bacterium]RCK28268.1 peptidase [Thalassospira profundimaris]MAL38690.1 signal peptide peptidase SppA [Thalassospira sp.]MBO6770576.1 signal peptide peptidase SppA [Thalassospira sp.]PKR50130.1 signal peptide peptidase SppA [Thalassospira povalilytica]|tara:strand:- start:1857 stop:2780 length:924 start_codon:yes stop_codon:yes gene_type:complete
MALDADILLDRRRLKKSVFRWRVVAVIAVIAVIIIGLAGTGVQNSVLGGIGPRIVEINIEGVITEDPYLLDALAAIEEDSDVVGVIVHINSPGGTMVGGETLYEALRRIGETRPIVAEMGTVAASGGYMTAIAADHIIARRGTITGSIGVIFQSMNFNGTLEKLGVEPLTVKSGPLKAAPNPFEPVDDAAKTAMQGLISDMFDVFVGMVAERRDMPVDTVKTLADGRVYTGQQALANGLIDEIGGRREALRWLENEAGVTPEADIVPLEIEYPEDDLMSALFEGNLGKVLSSEGLKLDGLLAVWQPE